MNMQMAQFPVFETFIALVVVLAILVIARYYYTIKAGKPKENKYLNALEEALEGNDRLAIQKFKEAIHEDTNNVAAYIHLGDLLRKRGLVDNALKIHRDLTFRGDLSPELRRRVNESLLQDYELVQDVAKCVDTAKKLLSDRGVADIKIAQKLVEYLEKQEDWAGAAKAARKYLNDSNPLTKKRIALYAVMEGLELQKEGKGRDARIKFKEALKLNKKCAAAYYYLGASYRLENRLDDAIEMWKKLCFEIPEKGHLVFRELEKAWFEMGRFADVENFYRELLRKDSRHLPAALALADIHSRKGEYDLALEIIDRFSDSHPENAALYAAKIKIYMEKNQYKAASSTASAYFEKNNITAAPKYQCQICSFVTDEPVWFCQQCHSLGSFDI